MSADKLTEVELKDCRHLWDISNSPTLMLTSLQTPESITESWNSKMAELGKKYTFDPKLTTINLQTGEINRAKQMERTELLEMKIIFDPDKAELNYTMRLEAGLDRMIEMEIARLRKEPETRAGGSPAYMISRWEPILEMLRRLAAH